jgi:hypothetical protein
MKHQHNTVHHWRRWLFMTFPPLAAVLCALVLVMPAWAATGTNIRFPIRGTGVMNPWNGETLTFNGECHTTLPVTLESSGGWHTEGRFIISPAIVQNTQREKGGMV